MSADELHYLGEGGEVSTDELHYLGEGAEVSADELHYLGEGGEVSANELLCAEHFVERCPEKEYSYLVYQFYPTANNTFRRQCVVGCFTQYPSVFV